MSKRGLPAGLQMRHDAHYVEELSQHRPTPIGRMIALERLDPNPDQPRVEIGDLEDLTSSIREKGVLEPLLVKPSSLGGRWMIIAGERRWRAAREAGIREVPCIEMDIDDRAVAEIALIENIQRKDLTPWEEADGLRALCERYGYTHEEAARKVGKSRSTVTEALSISTLPEDIRAQCRRADITSKSLLLEIVRQPDDESMRRITEAIINRGLNRDDVRASKRGRIRAESVANLPKYSVFKYTSPGRGFKLELTFRRSEVENSDIITALKEAIGKVRSTSESGGSDNVSDLSRNV